MSFSEVKKQLRKLGITIVKTDWEDFRINCHRGKESTASYHVDLVDALHSGLSLANVDEG